MANSRISDLSQKQVLLSNGFDQFADDDALFIMAREKSHNESVAYKDLKKSINDYSVLITGDQSITGEKSFYDNAFFKKDVKIDGDLRVQGDVFNLQFRDSAGQDLDQYLTNLDSNLSVAGNAELLSDATVFQNFTTVGDTELQGDALLKSNLEVEKESSFHGDADFESDVEIVGNQNLSGLLTVHDNAEFKKNVLVGKDLTVQGDVFNIKFEDSSGNTLDSYITDFDSNLRVKGESTLDKDVIAKENVIISGNESVFGALDVAQDSLFKKDLKISGELSVTGLSTQTLLNVKSDATFEETVTVENSGIFKSDLDVLGDTKLKKTDIDGNLTVVGTEARFAVDQAVFEKDVEVKGDLSVRGDVFNVKFDDGFGGNADNYLTDFDSNLQVKGNLGVTGDALIYSDLEVSGETSLKDTLEVTNKTTLLDELETIGNVNFQSELNVIGQTTLKNLEVTEDTELKGQLDVAGSTTLTDTLGVTKKATLLDNLEVIGDADLKSKLDVGGSVAFADTLDVTQKTTLLNELEVQDNTNLKNTNIDEQLTVKGNATFEQDVEVQGDLSVRGDLFNVKFDDGFGGNADNYLTDFDSNLQVKGSIGVTGNAFIYSELNVTDATILHDTLQVGEKATLLDELYVTQNAEFQSKLDVGSKTTLSDTLDVARQVTLSDDLDVSGDVDFKSKLDVADAVALADTLDVTQKTTLSADLDVGGAADLKGELDVAGATSIADTLDVTKKTTLSDDLDVSGDTDLQSKLDVAGTTALADTLDVTKKTTLLDDLDVTGDVDLKSKLDVAGATALSDTLDVTKDASFGDNLSLTNVLQLGPRAGIGSGYFNLFQDAPAALSGLEQFLTLSHNSKSTESGALLLHEGGSLNISTLDLTSMLNIEQQAGKSGVTISSQPAEVATLHLRELNQNFGLDIGLGKLEDAVVGPPGAIAPATIYGATASYIRSSKQDLAIFTSDTASNVCIGAGYKKLLTFTGTTDTHPVSGAEAGNDIIFGEHSNVGINVPEVALSPVTQDKFKLHVDGEVKIDGRLFATDVFETYPVIPKVGELHMGATVLRPQNVWDAGDQGTLFFDDDYIFICVQDSDGTDQNRIAWKRFAISEW